MKKLIFTISLILIAILIITFTATNTSYSQSVSVIYSSFQNGNYKYKNAYKESFIASGLTCEEYENTSLDRLDFNVDCILLSTVGNGENTQDLSKYNFKKYVEYGGVLIISDASYRSVLDFLPQTFGLEFKAGEISDIHEGNDALDLAIEYPIHHPILKNTKAPKIGWSVVSSLSPEFKPLYMDLKGRPVVVYTEIGKGLLIIGTPYKEMDFPRGEFVKNAINFAKSKKNGNKKPLNPMFLEINQKIDGELQPILGERSNKTKYSFNYDKNFINVDFIWENIDKETVAERTTRDSEVYKDDSIEVLIEYKGDIYRFALNKYTRYDAKNGNKNYDTYWESEIKTEGNTQTATFRIPLQSLDIRSDDQNIKINLIHSQSNNLSAIASLPAEDLTNTTFWQSVTLTTPLQIHPVKDLTLNIKETYNFGENKITLSHPYTFRVVNLTTNETFTGKEGVCPINFKKVGENEIMAVAFNGDTCVGFTPIYKVRINDLYSMDIIYPKYRDQVMSKDPNKNLRINLTATEPLTALFSLKSDKEIYTNKYNLTPKTPSLITYNLENLPVGNYSYNIKISDSKGKVIGNIDKFFKILPPKDVEITFDERNICYENGKPIFPIMLYHTSGMMVALVNAMRNPKTPEIIESQTLKEIKERGFTLGHTMMDDLSVADRYKDAGINIVVEIGDCRDRGTLQQFIDAYNRNKNGIFHYTIDEPLSEEKVAHSIEMYNILKEMDPYRPCGAAVVNSEVADAYDVLMPDPYIFIRKNPNPSLKDMSWIKDFKEKTGKPLWGVPQAFGWKHYGNQIMPTCEQMRCQAYYYIVCGATGLCWYAFVSGEEDKNTPYNSFCIYQYKKQWDYFKTLNREITQFAQILFKGISIGPLGRNNIVQSNAWKVGNKNYAIIVNPEPTAQKDTFKINEEIRPFFKEYSYSYTREGDNVTFFLKPYECVIIEY
ncbi:MAG: hypothetical protein IJS60_01795 [Abditibacteriota bacterium]|nr:hypothetical protein [Abditibacteriota bacterium]